MEEEYILSKDDDQIWKFTRKIIQMDTMLEDISSAIELTMDNGIEVKFYKNGKMKMSDGPKKEIEEMHVYDNKIVYVTDMYQLVLTRRIINKEEEIYKCFFSVGENGTNHEIVQKKEVINNEEEQKEIELQKSDIFIPEEEQRAIQRAITPEIDNIRTKKTRPKEAPIIQNVPMKVPRQQINYGQPISPIQQGIMQNTYFQSPPMHQVLNQQSNYHPIYQLGMQPIQPVMQEVPLQMGIPQMQVYPNGQQGMRQPMLQGQPLRQGMQRIPINAPRIQSMPIVQGVPGIMKQPRMQGPPIVPLTQKGRQTILQPFQQYRPGQLSNVNAVVQQKPVEKKKKDLTPKYNLKEVVNNPKFHQQMRELILTPSKTTPKKEVKKRTRTKRKVVEKGKKGEDLKEVTTPAQDPDDSATEDLTYIILDETTEEAK